MSPNQKSSPEPKAKASNLRKIIIKEVDYNCEKGDDMTDVLKL